MISFKDDTSHLRPMRDVLIAKIFVQVKEEVAQFLTLYDIQRLIAVSIIGLICNDFLPGHLLQSIARGVVEIHRG